jgi:hypothetical protein
MPALAPQRIESIGKNACRLRSAGQPTALKNLQRKVRVITPHHIGLQDPTGFSPDRTEPASNAGFVLHSAEHPNYRGIFQP